MNCKHVFIGDANGIKCQKCGMKMTAEEYAKHIQNKKKGAKKNERVSKAADVS